MRHAFPAAIVAAFSSLSAVAASSIVPAQPSSFDPVNLRMTVDSCAFAPATVRVTASGGTLKVAQQPNACLVPGTPRVVDVRLGTLAPGDYQVQVFSTVRTDGTPAESLRF